MFSNRSTFQRFADIVSGPEDALSVPEAALVAAADFRVGVSVEEHLLWIDTAAERAPEDIEAYSKFFCEELGFRGETDDYDDPENSLLDRVIDRRKGTPISLSILFIAVAETSGLIFEGVGFPGHFLVRHPATESYFDPFHGSELLSPVRARQRLQGLGRGSAWPEGRVAASRPREILFRLLTNLKLSLLERQDYKRAAGVQEKLLVLAPSRAQEYRDLGIVSASAGDWAMARRFLGEYLQIKPEAQDAELVRTQLQFLNDEMSRRN